MSMPFIGKNLYRVFLDNIWQDWMREKVNSLEFYAEERKKITLGKVEEIGSRPSLTG